MEEIDNKIRKGSKLYYLAIMALFIGSLVDFGIEYCVQPIIPIIAASFNLAPAKASLAVAAGTMGLAVSMFFIAMLSPKFKRNLGMSIALFGGVIMALIIAISPTFNLILLFRFLQGILLAAFPAMAVAYINEEFHPEVIGTAVGIYISGTAIGGLTGRLILSALTDFMSWRTALLLLGAVYLILTIAFVFLLPRSRATRNTSISVSSIVSGLKTILRSKHLMGLYAMVSLAMGAFVCTYNFISYVLMHEPYNLSQTVIGLVFLLYLLGSIASTVMGILSDRFGAGISICTSLILAILGLWISLFLSLILKIIGIGIFTFGFFGLHSSACGWAGRLADVDKGQITALYMFMFYLGASIFGSWGGIFLESNGWTGVVGFLTVILSLALIIAVWLWRSVHNIYIQKS